MAALNAGDAACTAFPRIYLDGDIQLSRTALTSLVEVLDRPEAVVASPRVEFDTRHSSILVRGFYDAFRHLPYVQRGLIGLGVYGVSSSGRQRFGRLPGPHRRRPLRAETLHAGRAHHVRRNLRGHRSSRQYVDLVKVRMRVARGNAELEASHPAEVTDATATSSSTLGALVRLVLGKPRLLPSAVVYAGVVVVARLDGRRDSGGWLPRRVVTLGQRPSSSLTNGSNSSAVSSE